MAVAFPEDIFALVHGGDGFVFPDWPTHYYDAQCFRVLGAQALLDDVKFTANHVTHAPKIALDMQANLPKGWPQAVAPTNVQWWTQLGGPQTKRAIKGQPQRFDRAAMSVMYMVRFLENNQVTITPAQLDMVRIVPIVHHVSVDDRSKLDALLNDASFLAALQAITLIKDESLTKQVAQGLRCVSEFTALDFADFLSDRGVTAKVEVWKNGQPPIADPEETLTSSRRRLGGHQANDSPAS